MPDRLDDDLMAKVASIAKAELPRLPACDVKSFGQMLRMMLSALPRRQADDISGELFVAAYERQLGHMSKPHLEYMMDKALRQCKWFPTIAECFELASGWVRRDEATERQKQAHRLFERENNARIADQYQWTQKSAMLMTQRMVDDMAPELQRIGLKCGALYKDKTGKVRPIREIEDSRDEDGIIY